MEQYKISCLRCTFHSCLEFCYDQFVNQGLSVFASTGFQILLPFKEAFQNENQLLNLSVRAWSGQVLEASLTLIVIPTLEFLFWFKVEPRGFSCQAFIGFLIGLFIHFGYQQEIRLSHLEKRL